MSVLTLASPGPLARAINRFTENRAALVGLAILAPMLIAILSLPALAGPSGPTTSTSWR